MLPAVQESNVYSLDRFYLLYNYKLWRRLRTNEFVFFLFLFFFLLLHIIMSWWDVNHNRTIHRIVYKQTFIHFAVILCKHFFTACGKRRKVIFLNLKMLYCHFLLKQNFCFFFSLSHSLKHFKLCSHSRFSWFSLYLFLDLNEIQKFLGAIRCESVIVVVVAWHNVTHHRPIQSEWSPPPSHQRQLPNY